MGIRFQLLLILLAIALTPLILLSNIIFDNSKREIQIIQEANLRAIAKLQEDRVSSVLDNFHTITDGISSRTKLRDEIVLLNRDPDQASINSIKKNIDDAKEPFDVIQDIAVYARTGELVTTTGNSFPKMFIASEYDFSMIRAGDGFEILSSSPFMLDGESIGTLVVSFSTEPLTMIAADHTGLGRTGEVIFAIENGNGDAEFITKGRYPNQPPTIARDQVRVPIVSAIQGIETNVENSLDYRGVPVLSATAHIDELGIGIVTKINEEEVFSSVEIIRYVSVSFGIIVIGVVILLSIALTSIFVTPINQLKKIANQLGKGKFNTKFKSQLLNRSDELGLLANTFSSMAKELGAIYADLEKRVKERTQDLQKYKLAVEEASDPIVITDASGVILYANASTEKITGYKKAEMIGKTPGLWGGQMGQNFYKKFWNTLAIKKKNFRGIVNNKRKNGTIYIAELHVSPVLSENGKVAFYVGIERDITKEKQIDKAKSEFVSLASHQLRTPLSTIAWYAEMMLDGDAGKVSKKQNKYLSQIYRGNERMIRLVNALLNATRMELGTFSVEPEDLDCAQLLKDLIVEQKAKLKDRGIKLELDIKPKSIPFKADPNLLSMIFENLISNAIKYSPDKSKVKVSLQKKGGNIVFKVQDQGYGIPENQQEKLFTKLFRASNVQEKDVDGTGLGLYIVKSIIDNLKGDISFASKENKGTTFTVKLPAKGMRKKSGSKKLTRE